MTVYVDDLRLAARVGRLRARWSHLFTDGPVEELHAFAARIGLRRDWFQAHDAALAHYDVTDTKRALALAYGAVPVPAHRSAAILYAAHARRTGVS